MACWKIKMNTIFENLFCDTCYNEYHRKLLFVYLVTRASRTKTTGNAMLLVFALP